jgi:Protein of unknown function (DUF2769)
MQDNKIVPDTVENIGKCQCPECPIYNKCMKDNNEHLFCSKGISKCDFNKTGCNCPTCPVWIEYQLISLFYCEKGFEKN